MPLKQETKPNQTNQVFVYLFDFFYFDFVAGWNGKIPEMTQFFCQLTLSLVFWTGFGDPFVSQNPREFYMSHSLEWIMVCARGVMVIVIGNGHGDTSSNPGLIAFHIALIPLGKI